MSSLAYDSAVPECLAQALAPHECQQQWCHFNQSTLPQRPLPRILYSSRSSKRRPASSTCTCGECLYMLGQPRRSRVRVRMPSDHDIKPRRETPRIIRQNTPQQPMIAVSEPNECFRCSISIPSGSAWSSMGYALVLEP